MSQLQPDLMPRPLFARFIAKSTSGRGVVLSARSTLGIATVIARTGATAMLAQRALERFGIDLPREPRLAASGALTFVGMGPGTWIALDERGREALLATLCGALNDLASLSDQSDGYAILRLSGARVRDALCKLVPVDLHPQVFRRGDVASTLAAHIGVTLWRPADCADGSSVFEIAFFRSFAASFLHALAESAAEFGCVLVDEPSDCLPQ